MELMPSVLVDIHPLAMMMCLNGYFLSDLNTSMVIQEIGNNDAPT